MIDLLITITIFGLIVWFFKKTCDHEFEDYED